MEHIKSNELIDRLDQYLGHPKFDPHGDAIPNAQGKFTIRNQYILDVLDESEVGVLVGVRNNAQDFLEYLNDLNIVEFDCNLCSNRKLWLRQTQGCHLCIHVS